MSHSEDETRTGVTGSGLTWRSEIRCPAWRAGFTAGTLLSSIAAIAIDWNTHSDGKGFLMMYVTFPLASVVSVLVAAFVACATEASSRSFAGLALKLMKAIVFGVPGSMFLGLVALGAFGLLPFGLFVALALTAAVAALISDHYMSSR